MGTKKPDDYYNFLPISYFCNEALSKSAQRPPRVIFTSPFSAPLVNFLVINGHNSN